MYIVAIGWIYVVLMMSISESSAVAGIMTFLFYGALPVAIILYLMDAPKRKRRRAAAEKARARQAENESRPGSETETSADRDRR